MRRFNLQPSIIELHKFECKSFLNHDKMTNCFKDFYLDYFDEN